jgi:hypothetical protein
MRDGFDLVGDRRVLAGGCAGVLVMALMQMAGGLPKQSAPAPDLKEVPH